jgi:hypothetical protein
MANDLIPEPNIQATNIPTGGSAQVSFDFAAPDNAFANLSKTIAGAAQTMVNFNELEVREQKSRDAWKEQLAQIHGLTETDQLSDADFLRIQREANAKAQKEGIIRAHENWSTMTAVSKERMRKLAAAKADFFQKRMGRLSNPDRDYREEYGVVEQEFNEQFGSEAIGLDSQGNPIFSDTSRMTPMELVAYSGSESVQREAIKKAVDDIAHNRSIEATELRNGQIIAEGYRRLVEHNPSGVSSEYITMPSTNPETGERFSSFAEQFSSATSRGEIIYNSSLEEAEGQAQDRSELLGEQLDLWEALNDQSAYLHPTTGRPIYYGEDGVPYSEISETFLNPEAEAFLDLVRNSMSAMRDGGVTNISDSVISTIGSIANQIAEDAPLGDNSVPKKINDLISIMQYEFSHMELNGKRVMFAPEGTKPHETLDTIRANALSAYSSNQKALAPSVDGDLAVVRENFRRTIRNGMTDEEKASMTYDRWVENKMAEASDAAATIRGFDDQDGLLRDLETIAGKLSSSDNGEGELLFDKLTTSLRRRTDLTNTDNSELTNVYDWINRQLVSEEGDSLTKEQFDTLKTQAESMAKESDERRADSPNKQLQGQLDAKTSAYSDIDVADANVNKRIYEIGRGSEFNFTKSADGVVDFDIVNEDVATRLSTESNRMSDALNSQGEYRLDKVPKYVNSEAIDKDFAKVILSETSVPLDELLRLQENIKLLREGIDFSEGDLSAKVTKYSRAMADLETLAALSALYEHSKTRMESPTLSDREKEYLKGLETPSSSDKDNTVSESASGAGTAGNNPVPRQYGEMDAQVVGVPPSTTPLSDQENQGGATSQGGGRLGASPEEEAKDPEARGKDPEARNYFLNPMTPDEAKR